MNDSDVRLDSDDGPSGSELPLSVAHQIDRLCDEYEAQFDETSPDGGAAAFGPFVERIDPLGRPQLIAELIGAAIDRLQVVGVADLRSGLVARNAEFAPQIDAALRDFSSNRETTIFEPPTAKRGHDTTPKFTPRRKKSRGLHIRCPHCSNHVEVVGDTDLDSVNCDVCGSTFSLVDRSKETKLAEALQQIDRFELVSRLGVGGFGTVWKARDRELDRIVAIKIPRHGQLSPDEMEQFFREARSVAQLRHPNIVPVHEVGREGDTVFIVSDLVRGVSLSDQLTSKSLTPIEAAALCAKIAGALDHAHCRGVIHRDLKPSNVMIEDDGEPHLMDFGLAKREAEEVTMTVDGQIIGTPAYMSPEQASGKSAWADRRADVYSLGVILFELLTGELPFRGNAQMQVHQRLNDEAPNARTLNRHLPIDLATICAKCLEREPGRRYQTANAVGEELTRFLEKLPIKARPRSPLGRLFRWAQRRPMQATVAALVTFLAIAGPSVAVVIDRQRARLGGLVAEKDNLIQKREAENRKAIANSGQLQRQLNLWEGRASPSELWPPTPAESPKQRQLASLLAARRDALEKPDKPESQLEQAQRTLALATLYEATNRSDDARGQLIEAVEILQILRRTESDRARIELALADCYDRLAAATAKDDRPASLEWLEKSLALRRELAEASGGDPWLQALRLDAELRSGAAAGFEAVRDELVAAQELETRLRASWPESPEEIYRLACRLAGRTPMLANEATDPND